MYATNWVPFVGCKMTILTILENDPTLKYIPTSDKEKTEVFVVFLFSKLFFFQTVFMNENLKRHFLLNQVYVLQLINNLLISYLQCCNCQTNKYIIKFLDSRFDCSFN